MPLNNLITRLPNGVVNVADNNVFANLSVLDPTGFHTFLEDFDQFTAAQWTTGGVGTPVAPALAAGDGGLLTLTTSAADNDNNWLQQLVPAWTLVAGKKLFFRARATINSTSAGELVLGLQIAVAANNFLTPVNGLFIRRNDAAADLLLVNRSAGVETVSGSLGQVTTGVPFEVSFAYDGQGTIVGAFNGVAAAAITPTAITAIALGVVAGVQNGGAVSRTLTVDQLYCAKER